MTTLGWMGVWMLVAGVLAVVLELVVAALWSRRVSRRARELSRSLAAQRDVVTADAARLRQALEETRLLWQPYRRALHWLRHPLTVALLQSFVRRLASARG